MRLWSIHPRYLDRVGLGALWREGLLAQKVLAGETRGWRSHPQLARFAGHPKPLEAIGFYLAAVRGEASSRGYAYDGMKIRRQTADVERIPISVGQIEYEFGLLLSRTAVRSPAWHEVLRKVAGIPEANPVFSVVEGGPAVWEVSYWRMAGDASKPSAPSHHRATESSRMS